MPGSNSSTSSRELGSTGGHSKSSHRTTGPSLSSKSSSHRCSRTSSRSSHHSHHSKASLKSYCSSSSIPSRSTTLSLREVRRAQLESKLKMRKAQLTLQASADAVHDALVRAEGEAIAKRKLEEAALRREEADAEKRAIRRKMEQAAARRKREEERAEAILAKAKRDHRQKSYNAQLKVQCKKHEVDLVVLEAEPVGSCDSSHEYRLDMPPLNQIDATRMERSAHLQQTANDLATMDSPMPGEMQTSSGFTPLATAKLSQPEYSVAHPAAQPNVSASPYLPVCPQTDIKHETHSPSMGPVSNYKPCHSDESFTKDDIHYGKAITDLVESTKIVLHGFTLPKRELPKFHGNPMHYHNFMKRFDEMITKHFPDPAVQLQCLVDMCKDKAYDVVHGCCAKSPPELGLATARQFLRDNFGRMDLVVNAHVKQLTNGPPITTGDNEGIRSLATSMSNALMVFQSLSCESQLDYSQFLVDIFQRLPKSILYGFVTEASSLYKKNGNVTFSNLSLYLNQKVMNSNNMFADALNTVKEWEPRKGKPQKKKEHAVFSAQTTQSSSLHKYVEKAKPPDETKKKKPQPCVVCNKPHPLWVCDEFQRKK